MHTPRRSVVLALLLSLALASSTHGADERQDDNSQRPVAYEYFKSSWFHPLVDFGCNVRELLKDREVSNRFYHLIDNVGTIIPRALKCGDKLYVQAIKNENSALSRGFKAVLLGKSIEVNSLVDIWRNLPNVLQLVFNMPVILGQLDLFKVQDEVAEIMKQFKQQCVVEGVEEYKADTDYIQKRMEELFQKTE